MVNGVVGSNTHRSSTPRSSEGSRSSTTGTARVREWRGHEGRADLHARSRACAPLARRDSAVRRRPCHAAPTTTSSGGATRSRPSSSCRCSTLPRSSTTVETSPLSWTDSPALQGEHAGRAPTHPRRGLADVGRVPCRLPSPNSHGCSICLGSGAARGGNFYNTHAGPGEQALRPRTIASTWEGRTLYSDAARDARLQEAVDVRRARPQPRRRLMAYLLDTNVFIQAKNLYYGFDFCPAFWDWLGRGAQPRHGLQHRACCR